MNHNKPVEHNDLMVPPTFEFPVFGAEDEEDDDIPDEITQLLEQEEKAIQPHQERLSCLTWVPRIIQPRRPRSKLEGSSGV